MFWNFALAEFERKLIAERNRAGLAVARARGRKGGRPRKMTKTALQMLMAAMADRNSVATNVAKRLGNTTTTLYTYVNGDGSLKGEITGLLNGIDSTDAAKLEDEKRLKAIKSVNELFTGFINQFGETDYTALTGCDWSKKEDIKRYFEDEIYKDTCFRQFEYVIEKCVAEQSSMKGVEI